MRGWRSGRARAAFVWGIALFLLVQLSAGVVLDCFGLPLRFAEASAVVSQFSPEANPEVIFLGSSRFLGGVATEEVARCTGRKPDAVMNAAVTAGDVIAADLVLARLIERGARPNLVVVEVSPDTLNHRTYWLRYHITRQLTWADVPRYAGDVIEIGDVGTLLLSRFLPLYYFRHHVMSPDRTEAVRPRALKLGPTTQEGSVLTPQQLARSRQGVPHVLQMLEDFHTGGLTGEALERLLNRCTAIGARVVLVGVPVTSAGRATYTSEIDGGYREFLAGLVRRHDCRFVDYRDRLPDHQFVDVHHLSAEGGRHFSRLLAEETALGRHPARKPTASGR